MTISLSHAHALSRVLSLLRAIAARGKHCFQVLIKKTSGATCARALAVPPTRIHTDHVRALARARSRTHLIHLSRVHTLIYLLRARSNIYISVARTYICCIYLLRARTHICCAHAHTSILCTYSRHARTPARTQLTSSRCWKGST